jgi:uncharacterized Zn finger protein (UPF0148 family)
MASSTIHCPHCKKPVTVETGELATCPKCGGDLRVHEVGADEQDEALKRLLSRVKIVERVDKSADEPSADEPIVDKPTKKRKKKPAPPKRPWWKFWG